MTIHTEYLVDEKGAKKSVVLSIRDYLRLWEYLESMEDALDLKKAKESARGFVDVKKRHWINRYGYKILCPKSARNETIRTEQCNEQMQTETPMRLNDATKHVGAQYFVPEMRTK